jgi:hypothetical protein
MAQLEAIYKFLTAFSSKALSRTLNNPSPYLSPLLTLKLCDSCPWILNSQVESLTVIVTRCSNLWGITNSFARGSVVGWGSMLQDGSSRVRFPMRSLDFFNLPNPSSRTMILGSTQPPTEVSTKNLPRGERRPALKADNHTAICEPIV